MKQIETGNETKVLVAEKTIISRETSRWYTLDFVGAKRKRDKVYKQFISTNTDNDWF